MSSVLVEQQINFYRESLAPSGDSLSLSKLLQMTAGIVIGMFVFYGWGYWNTHDLEHQRDELKSILAARTEQLNLAGQTVRAEEESKQALQHEFSELEQQRIAKIEAVKTLEKKNTAHQLALSGFMETLSHKVPNGLWLTGFSIDEFRENLTILGRSTQPALIPEFIERLSSESGMHGIRFRRLDIDDLSNLGRFADFTLHSKAQDDNASGTGGKS